MAAPIKNCNNYSKLPFNLWGDTMFLEEILAYKKVEIKLKKEQQPFDSLYSRLNQGNSPSRPFKSSLNKGSIALIAEVKKASPSKGLLCPNFNPVALAKSYEKAGAAAISVLTDAKFFQGSLADLKQVKETTRLVPVLRKDFIIDHYQLLEARLYGADAVLLIVAALTRSDLDRLSKEALALGLATLAEVHNREELDLALEANADIIGINNRDLKSFVVNIETTFDLLQYIPGGKTIVAESGINHRADVERLAQAGVHAVLIGEAIVTAADPVAKIRELLGSAS
jgi:indole-3-glycerol phosphate synthase